jgi:hypothetical protein
MDFKFFLIFISFISFRVSSCELSKEIVSFSGPITTLLEEFNLLDDKKLMGISQLTPLLSKSQVRRFSGGIFISKKMLKDYSGSLFFYDKSIDLTKTFKRSSVKSYLEIDTRDLTPFQAVDYLLNELTPYLVKCESKITKFKSKLVKIDKALKTKLKKNKIVFFLGTIDKNKKLPELVISNDGFVKYLRKFKLIETYKSEFAYVNWSQKELNKLKGEYHLIGISDSVTDKLVMQKISSKYINLYFNGALIPGVRQVYLLKEFLSLGLQ